MKNIILVLLVVLGNLALTSCTLESAAKKAAIQAAKDQNREGLRKEMEDVLDPKTVLGSTYLNYLDRHTECTVSEITMEGENAAVAKVQIESIAFENRRALANIAARTPPDHIGNFNMGNALNLIEQQPGMVKGKKISFVTLRLKKTGDTWTAAAP